jgi:GNAT superfamily N-acetyltransferase
MASELTVYYVEMLARPAGEPVPPLEGLTVVHARRPTVAYYRFLYDTVGRDYNWSSRARLTDAELDAILGSPHNEVHVLHVDGTPAGFVEFDRRVQGEIEIVQFGLMPGFIGRGLGKYLLRWAVDRAWNYGPRRLWLHTDTDDHPNALPNYLKGGFVLYKEEVKGREGPNREGPP